MAVITQTFILLLNIFELQYIHLFPMTTTTHQHWTVNGLPINADKLKHIGSAEAIRMKYFYYIYSNL